MSYVTLREAASASFIERKSEFIAHAAPVKTEEEAMAFINGIRAKYGDATHNVWAYNLQHGHCRCSDDGEPQGTAGAPVLDAIQKSGVEDAVVVVTRYFGGILLGAGGLVRAYSRGAHDALEAAGICEVVLCEEIRVTVDYTSYGKVQYILPDYGAKVLDTQWADDVTIDLRLRADQAEKLRAALLELTAGRCVPETLGTLYADM